MHQTYVFEIIEIAQEGRCKDGARSREVASKHFANLVKAKAASAVAPILPQYDPTQHLSAMTALKESEDGLRWPTRRVVAHWPACGPIVPAVS